MLMDGFATGLVVESHQGRPTMIDGNPLHPASLSGSSPQQNASVYDLYDPHRAQDVTRRTGARRIVLAPHRHRLDLPMAAPVSDEIGKPVTRANGRALLWTLLALLFLTGASWWLAHLPLGPFHAIAALGTAFMKASTVGFVFMELSRSGTVPRFIAALTLLFIALLCAGVLGDALLR
jgi:caa(3)-type oxidase subunit IV